MEMLKGSTPSTVIGKDNLGTRSEYSLSMLLKKKLEEICSEEETDLATIWNAQSSRVVRRSDFKELVWQRGRHRHRGPTEAFETRWMVYVSLPGCVIH